MRFRALPSAAALMLVPAFASAQSNPVATAFRENAKEAEKNLIAASEELDGSKYGFKPTPAQMSFGDIVAHLSQGNDFLCGNIGGMKAPTRAKVATTAGKAALMTRLKETFAFCDQALASLDEYERRFAAGALAPEAAAARIDALLALGQRPQALSRLEALSLDRMPRGAELRTLRGELRAGRGALGAALDDFTAVLAMPGAAPSVVERALYGRGSCRSRLGDVAGARADLSEVLRRFPNGSFAEPARRALRD